jgi:hypothetical protein
MTTIKAVGRLQNSFLNEVWKDHDNVSGWVRILIHLDLKKLSQGERLYRNLASGDDTFRELSKASVVACATVRNQINLDA